MVGTSKEPDRIKVLSIAKSHCTVISLTGHPKKEGNPNQPKPFV